MVMNDVKVEGFGDDSPSRRNILLIGSRGIGKTYLLQKWVVVFKPNKKPLVLHEKEKEWEGYDVECLRVGMLNRKSLLREAARNRTVVVDDALNLTKNYADKLLGLASVNRALNSTFIVSLQGLGVLKERRDALSVFDTIIFFKGSEGCAFVVKNTTRFSKEVELVRKKIEELGLHEILVYDSESNLWYKTTNEDTQLLNDLLTKPLAKGQKLEPAQLPSEGSSKNFQIESKKIRIKGLIEKGFGRRQIVREVDTTVGYLTKVLSELRFEGFDIPKVKVGRPRECALSEPIILEEVVGVVDV